jgi:hypothetical protein
VDRLAAAIAAANPGYQLRAGELEGEVDVAPQGGGVQYLWPVDGLGEVWLPAGYRTQEGDGAGANGGATLAGLPASYRPDRPPDELAAHLAALRLALAAGAFHPQVRAAPAGICARWSGGTYRGDLAGDLWTLLESGLAPREWTGDAAARQALAWLMRAHRSLGWSTKEASGWERLQAGDQVAATGSAPIRVRGHFRYWALEDSGGATPACSAVRRLRYLRDTAGGCSPGFDAFRRLNLTWLPPPATQERVVAALDGKPAGHATAPAPSDADAPNRLNSHVLHIEAAQSRTHYHPVAPVGGGRPQTELYFALDPSAYALHAPPGTVPRLYTFPHLDAWENYEVTELVPGTAAFMAPGTGHRGLDAFVNIVTIPGFKPGNERYLDRLIRDRGAGAPYNAALL